MLRFVLTILVLFSFQSLSAQSLHTKNKKAIDSYQKAKEFSQVGNLYESEKLLISALKRDKSFDEAVLLLHQLYLRRDLPLKSESTFSNHRSELEQSFVNRILADQANYFYELGQYGKASSVLSEINGEVFEIPEDILKLLEESVSFAMDQIKDPVKIDFQKLPDPLNQFGQQYFPSMTASGKLVFTVRENEGRGNENLYFSLDSMDHWTKPELLSAKINTDRNEGTASISADGSTLVFTACNIPGNVGSCDLYISYFENGQWSKPELLSNDVNSEAWDSQPALSRDGKKLYFVSRRSGGLGKQDIWLSYKTETGWTKAVNLGREINTPYDDCSPYIYIDDQTLFFATKGRAGMGGFDLFKSRNSGSGWSTPENLGYPINNSFDQIGYCISPDKWAYYSSTLENGKIELNRFKLPDQIISSQPGELISGRVLDAKTLRPIHATVRIIQDQLNVVLKNINNEARTGRFATVINPVDFKVQVNSPGYRTALINQSTFDNLSSVDILMKRYEMGEKISFGDINFDFGSSKLLQESYKVLNDFIDFIYAHNNLVIEIGGHTDAIGEKKSNKDLSLDRAISVYQFFIEKGVPKENLVYKGYGEAYPLTSGNSGIERFKNRRIEFKVIDFLK